MSFDEAIYARMCEAASATLGELFELAGEGEAAEVVRLRPGADGPSLSAVSALLRSRVVAAVLDGEEVSIEALPLPDIPRHFEVQLEILWRHHQADAADREAIAGAFDRIAAELYLLSIDDLMRLQMAEE